jgi:outer membrane protein OmpA-like peptidoglycan-associated protein
MSGAGKSILIFLAVVGGGFLGMKHMVGTGIIPKPAERKSVEAAPISIPDAPEPAQVAKSASKPVQRVAAVVPADARATLKCEIWAWQSQTALIWANGGATTAPGSAIGQAGGSLQLTRQDDVPQMQKDMVAYAQAYASGDKNPTMGTACVNIMWDGAAAFLAAVNPVLERLGSEYRAVNIGSVGFSRGEDKCMGPPEWKEDPQKARGGLIAAVVRDGDWNICMKWMSDNGICNNPDETTYDPNCVNWYNTPSFTAAAQKYVEGFCDDRQVVDSIERKRVCVQGVATWTPGDVTVATKKGGLVSLASTKEYRWQMPAALIVIDKVARDQRQNVKTIFKAAFDAAEDIKSDESRQLLRKATALNAEVFAEETPDYWYTYFDVQHVADAQKRAGKPCCTVELGGSSVNNLADNLYIMGLVYNPVSGKYEQKGTDLLKVVYDTFGTLVSKQYPDLVPTYPNYAQIMDKSYVLEIANENKPKQAPDLPVIPATARVREEVSRKPVYIQFDTGKATIRPESEAALKEVLESASIAGELVIVIEGHTDSSGNPNNNQRLSEARANSVREWLQAHGGDLPNIKAAKVEAYGQAKPLVPNEVGGKPNPENMAKNRRVEIVFGQVS